MKLIIFTTIICILMVTTCSAQFQSSTINTSSHEFANFSNITNATILNNTSTNSSFLLLPANGTNITALQYQFGNNTPQYILNSTVILIPLNATQQQNITEQFPSVVNRTFYVNTTSFDQWPNLSSNPGSMNNPGFQVPSAPSLSPPMNPRPGNENTQGNYGFVNPPPTGNNPPTNINRPNNPNNVVQHPNSPNNGVQHPNNPPQQPNNNSKHPNNTTVQNKNSGTILKSPLIYVVILKSIVAYLLF